MDAPKPKRTYKDSLFCKKFSNPEDLAALQTLISERPTSPEEITINTLDHALFSQERNDSTMCKGALTPGSRWTKPWSRPWITA